MDNTDKRLFYQHKSHYMITPFMKFLPIFNFAIGTVALTFQMTVLYPWHQQLEEEFQELKKVQQQELYKFHQLKVSKLLDMDGKISKILQLVEKNEK